MKKIAISKIFVRITIPIRISRWLEFGVHIAGVKMFFDEIIFDDDATNLTEPHVGIARWASSLNLRVATSLKELFVSLIF